MIRGITFDFWNTLVRIDPHAGSVQADIMSDVLAAAGVEVSRAELDAGRSAVKDWFERRWQANAPITPEEGGWELATALGLADRVELVHRLGAVYRAGVDPSYISPADGVAEALSGLRDRGVRIGIICDASLTPGATLRGYLDAHGLLRHFDHFVFSDEHGAYKPDASLFAAAMVGLGIDDPAQVAHIGDLLRTDIAGAVSVGFTSIRYRGFHDDDSAYPDAHIVIDDMSELLAALGLD